MQMTLEAHAPGTRKPLPEHQRLLDLAGEWRLEGHNLDGAPDRPGAAVSGHSTFHWLPGKFFLFGRESVSFEGQTHITLMVFAYLADVFILPEARGRGWGRAMVRFALGLSAVREAGRVLLGTRDAQGLYRGEGFEPVPAGRYMLRGA